MIEDYVVVNGSGIGGIGGIAGKGLGIGGGIGAFVVWNVKVDTLEVCVLSLSFSYRHIICGSPRSIVMYTNRDMETGNSNNNPQTLQRICRSTIETSSHIP